MNIEVGKFYKHYKGNIYKIDTIATHTETEQLMVVYHGIDIPSKIWTRPLKMFNEIITKGDGNGKIMKVPRFSLMDNNEPLTIKCKKCNTEVVVNEFGMYKQYHDCDK